MEENVLFAFGLTLLAGLSTGIGSAMAFFAKRTSTRFLSVSLGFSAGVMIYVSTIEIFPKALEALSADHGEKTGTWITVLAFFGGMLLIALIDRLVPSAENPHEAYQLEEVRKGMIHQDGRSTLEKNADVVAGVTGEPDPGQPEGPSAKKAVGGAPDEQDKKKLMRMGLLTALAIAIHNFPEGLATFIAGLQDPTIAIPIAVAIAIHNIPEGIAVSVPVYYATGDKKKAFLYSFLSGLSEPVGALVGYLLLRPFLTDTLFGIVFASVAGIMVFISLDELLPSAREYGEPHLSIYGMVAGMAVMALSILLFL